MKIKVLSALTEKGIEKKVNAFLEEHPVKILEMQYGATSSYYSVMIVYEGDIGL